MAKGVAKRTKEQIRKSSTKQLEAEGQLASRPFCTSQTNSVKKILKGKSQSRKKKTCQLSWDLQGTGYWCHPSGFFGWMLFLWCFLVNDSKHIYTSPILVGISWRHRLQTFSEKSRMFNSFWDFESSWPKNIQNTD